MSSVHFSTNPYWGALLWDNSPPLYHFLLKIWIAATSTSEQATRSLSGIFSVGTTALWLYFGSKLWDRKTSLLVAFLHAGLYLSIFYARETRMYALFEFSSTLVIGLTLLETKGKQVPNYIYMPALLMLALSHYLSFVPLIFTSAWIFFLAEDKNAKRTAVVPLLLGLISGILAFTIIIKWWPLDWLTVLFQNSPQARWPWEMSITVFGGLFGCIALATLACFALITKNRFAYLPVISVAVALIGALIFSHYLQRAVFLPRYFIYFSPWIILTVGGVAYHFWRTIQLKQFYVCLGLAGVFFGFQIKDSLSALERKNPSWREAAAYIQTLERPVIFTTRPLSLASPYFSDRHIPFKNFTLDGYKSYDALLGATREGFKPIILENESGYSFYAGALSTYLQTYNCQQQRLNEQELSGILLIEIQCPSP